LKLKKGKKYLNFKQKAMVANGHTSRLSSAERRKEFLMLDARTALRLCGHGHHIRKSKINVHTDRPRAREASCCIPNKTPKQEKWNNNNNKKCASCLHFTCLFIIKGVKD
jgi:hypothetical protein